MNNFAKGLLGVFILSTFVQVVSLSAQVSTTTNFNDDSNVSTTTRRDYIYGWRRGNNELQQKINNLSSTSSPSVTMPVLFGVEIRDISPNFGDPRSNGRTHAGEDIMAVKGTPIVSPTEAVVLRTGVGSGEGNYVYTANPGGETFVYMHLDRFAEGIASGTILEKGSLIGYVGDTGNALGGPAHLHFEIHDSNGVPTDPYPRITTTFTLQEKIDFLNKILLQSSNQSDLIKFLVTNFRQTFSNAISTNISLPKTITDYMNSLPVNTNTEVNTSTHNGYIGIGSSGQEVVELQNYLIGKNMGSNALELFRAGATGYFGPITQSALIEFQTNSQIYPATGYYDDNTKNYIESHPLTISNSTTNSNQNTNVNNKNEKLILVRNLYNGITGNDVIELQKFLNKNGFILASSGPGSINNETNYFGSVTESAVIKFQISRNITPSVGYVGPITRKAIEDLN